MTSLTEQTSSQSPSEPSQSDPLTSNPAQGQNQALTPTITKISNFLEMKKILINQFWQSNRNYASSEDIQKFCQLCGLKLGIHDQINLKSQMFFQREVISIYEFCLLVPIWRRNGSQAVGEFLRDRSEQLVNNLNAKNKNNRIKSSSGYNTRPASINSTLLLSQKKPRQYSATKQSSNHTNLILNPLSQAQPILQPYKGNNSKKYLQQARLKNLKKQQELCETIQKTKNEHEYNMLMKMNQLNQYHHKNKSITTYRAYKNAEGIIKVRVFELENFKKELTIQEFQSQYKVYKKSTKENKNWEGSRLERPLSSMKQTSSNNFLMAKILQNSTNIYNSTKNQKKQQRQMQLKNLLVSTVNLTKLLEEQIKIFKMKGINGCQSL